MDERSDGYTCGCDVTPFCGIHGAPFRAQAEGGTVPELPPDDPIVQPTDNAALIATLESIIEAQRRAGFHSTADDLQRCRDRLAQPADVSEPPLPDVIERAVAWLRSLQFGQPDAYNCADLLEQAARHAATEYTRGAETMREAAAKHIERGRTILDIQVAPELLRDGNPAAVVQLISADAEAATRQRIVQVIRALPLPEPPK